MDHNTELALNALAVEILYGDGAHELIVKASKEEREERLRQFGLATNAASVVAGPAAIGLAARAAKDNQGGIPRAGLKAVAAKKPNSKIGQRAGKIAHALDTKKGRLGTAGALAAAGGLVTLQGMNWAGDMVATRALARKPEYDKKKVAKSSPDMADLNTGHEKKNKVYLTRGTLALMAADKSKPVVIEGGKKTGQAAVWAGKKTVAGSKKAAEVSEPVIVDVARKFKEKVGKREWNGSASSASSSSASSSSGPSDLDLTWEGEFAKRDDEKRQVFGWASITEINGEPVIDLQGDYITTEEIEKAAYEYVQKSRKGGDMHRRDGDQPYHASEMIESFMVTPDKKQAMGLPDSTPTGWWVGFQVHDEDTWNLVKSGKRTGFSIHGKGKRAPMSEAS